MMDAVLPFAWLGSNFMKNAFLAVLLVTPLFGLISTMVVSNRMAFFSDSLGHGAFTGIAIGVLLGSVSPLLRRRPFVKNFLQAMPSVSSEMQKVRSFVPDLNSSRRMPDPGPSPIVPSTTTLLISPTSSVILCSAPETPRPKMRLPLSCTTTGSLSWAV